MCVCVCVCEGVLANRYEHWGMIRGPIMGKLFNPSPHFFMGGGGILRGVRPRLAGYKYRPWRGLGTPDASPFPSETMIGLALLMLLGAAGKLPHWQTLTHTHRMTHTHSYTGMIYPCKHGYKHANKHTQRQTHWYRGKLMQIQIPTQTQMLFFLSVWIVIVCACLYGPPDCLMCPTAAVPREDGRIIGGQDCEPRSRPFMASLNYGYHFCGGVLINDQWVLSVAHCWYKWVWLLFWARQEF